MSLRELKMKMKREAFIAKLEASEEDRRRRLEREMVRASISDQSPPDPVAARAALDIRNQKALDALKGQNRVLSAIIEHRKNHPICKTV